MQFVLRYVVIALEQLHTRAYASMCYLVTEFKHNTWNGVCYGPKIAVFLEILASASVLGLNRYQVHCSQRLVYFLCRFCLEYSSLAMELGLLRTEKKQDEQTGDHVNFGLSP